MTTVAMELSTEAPDDGFTVLRRQKYDNLCPQFTSCHFTGDSNDCLDLSKLIFANDEIWLCESPCRVETNLKKWLYSSNEDVRLSSKNIDTRTFTRPKKRFVRPSIEKYNEELYGNDLKELSDSGIQVNGCSQESLGKPLHFDLEQTTSSVFFENMLLNAPMTDSFQNMSPPSLVNSMCSSTFANLMESSFIKNDPELRQIRDTDYTGSILLQDTEPFFESITESCSSLNSDIPEQFLKKVSYTEKSDDLNSTVDLNATVVLNTTFTQEEQPLEQTVIVNKFQATTNDDLNATYPRTPKKAQNESPLNATFQRRKNKSFEPDLNSITITKHRDDRTIENVKRLLDRRPSPSLDLNRLSYLVDEKDPIKAAFGNDVSKRNSFGSTDSGENLDYMSLSSGSSKSSKRQSIDSINMIVDFQEPKVTNIGTYRKTPSGLQQVMSTPKCRKGVATTLWPNHEISPIGDRNSDPELSSNELPATVMHTTIRKQKSTGHLNRIVPRNSTVGQPSAIRGSQPSLKTTGLQKPTNLNSMGHTLKGSYTSLRPTNTNLPVAPPPLDTTVTMAKAPPIVAQVPPVPREVPLKSQDAQFARPQIPRSGLPRPVTGIPRPVSRIPGPKAARPVAKSAGSQGRY